MNKKLIGINAPASISQKAQRLDFSIFTIGLASMKRSRFKRFTTARGRWVNSFGWCRTYFQKRPNYGMFIRVRQSLPWNICKYPVREHKKTGLFKRRPKRVVRVLRKNGFASKRGKIIILY